MIPKIIHQMWLQGRDNMPEAYIQSIETWQACNADWEYKFWDEPSILELLSNHYPEYVEQWTSIDKIIKKCDAARYFILHYYGGVYADLDTFCYGQISDLISLLSLDEVDIILSEESHEPHCWKSKIRQMVAEKQELETIVGNAVLISTSRQDFWLEFLDQSFMVASKSVLESFSTWHLTKFLDSRQSKSHVAVIPSDYLLSMHYIEGCSFSTHMYHATWFNYHSTRPWEG